MQETAFRQRLSSADQDIDFDDIDDIDDDVDSKRGGLIGAVTGGVSEAVLVLKAAAHAKLSAHRPVHQQHLRAGVVGGLPDDILDGILLSIRHSESEAHVLSVAASGDGATLVSGAEDGSVKFFVRATNKLTTLPEPHSQCVTAVAVSANALWAASASTDGTAKIFVLGSSPRVVCTLRGHASSVTAVVFADDGGGGGDGDGKIVTGSADKTVKIWARHTGQCAQTLSGHTGVVTSVAVAANMLVVSGSLDATVKLWALTTGACTTTLTGHAGSVYAVAVSALGRYAVSAGQDGTVRVWECATAQAVHTLSGHTDYCGAVAFSADARFVVSGSYDRSVKVWARESGRCEATLACHHGVVAVAVSRDGGEIVSTGNGVGCVTVWANPVASTSVCDAYDNDGSEVRALAVSADGQFVLSASDKKIVVTDRARGGARVCVLEGHTRAVTACCVSADGATLVSASRDATLKVWGLAPAGKCEWTLRGHDRAVLALAVATTAAGTYIVSGGKDKVVKVWLWAQGAGQTLASYPAGNAVHAVGLTARAEHVFFSAGAVVKMVDRAAGSSLAVFHGHVDLIQALALSIDGKTLFTASRDTQVKVFDVLSGKELHTFAGHSEPVTALATLGSYVATGCAGGFVKVWDVGKKQCVSTLEGNGKSVLAVALVAQTGEGEGDLVVVSGGADKAVRVWAAKHPYFDFVNCVAASTRAQDAMAAATAVLRLQGNPSLNLLSSVLACGPATTTTTTSSSSATLLSTAIAHGISAAGLQALFALPNQKGLWSSLLHESSLHSAGNTRLSALAMLVRQREKPSLEVLLEKMVSSFRQWQQYREGTLAFAAAEWLLAPSAAVCNTTLTRDLCRLIKEYPDLAAGFLRKVGALRTRAQVDGDGNGGGGGGGGGGGAALKAVLPLGAAFLVKGSGELSPRAFWQLETDVGCLPPKLARQAQLVQSRVIPFAFAAGDGGEGAGDTLLQTVVDANRADLFDNATLRAVVAFQWAAFGRRKFLLDLAYYFLNLGCLLVLLFANSGVVGWTKLVHDGGRRDQLAVAAALGLAALSAPTLWHEVRAVWKISARAFYADPWNWLDLAVLGLTWGTVAAFLGGWVHFPALLSLAILGKWIGVLYYLQAFSSTGPLIRMILQIFSDMMYFILVLAIAVLGWASAFYALLHHATPGVDNEFGNAASALYVMFNMLILNQFDNGVFLIGDYAVLVRLLFIAGMVFTLIVLLNLLIAVMSDSFERIADRSDIEFLLLRGRILLNQQQFFSPRERAANRQQYFPAYLHLLAPAGDAQLQHADGEQWGGVLNALKTENRALQSQLATVEGKVDALVDQLQALLARGPAGPGAPTGALPLLRVNASGAFSSQEA